MRLMRPSPGEAYDRITILQLKVAKAVALEKNDAAAIFIEEQQALTEYMEGSHYRVPPDLGTELAKINERLWKLEDRQRDLLKENREFDGLEFNHPVIGEFARNAVTVLQLNDARAAAVQMINAACNVYQPEKLHYAT